MRCKWFFRKTSLCGIKYEWSQIIALFSFKCLFSEIWTTFNKNISILVWSRNDHKWRILFPFKRLFLQVRMIFHKNSETSRLVWSGSDPKLTSIFYLKAYFLRWGKFKFFFQKFWYLDIVGFKCTQQNLRITFFLMEGLFSFKCLLTKVWMIFHNNIEISSLAWSGSDPELTSVFYLNVYLLRWCRFRIFSKNVDI